MNKKFLQVLAVIIGSGILYYFIYTAQQARKKSAILMEQFKEVEKSLIKSDDSIAPLNDSIGNELLKPEETH